MPLYRIRDSRHEHRIVSALDMIRDGGQLYHDYDGRQPNASNIHLDNTIDRCILTKLHEQGFWVYEQATESQRCWRYLKCEAV